jgi:deoxyguanosine kinase
LNSYNYIVIEGNIGAGKTSLTKKIAADFNAKLILEQFAENPFLPKFYENPERYSFPLELSFLAERYRQFNDELSSRDLFKTFTISDYYFMKSLIFAGNTLSADEYNLYRQIFNIIYNSLPKPDLYVFLHLPTDKLLNNIRKRGRSYEQNITADYLEKIQSGYFEFFRQITDLTYVIIDTNNINFVENDNDYKQILKIIFETEHKEEINRFAF